MNRDFKGVWIPKEIWTNQDLSIIEKCLIIEIDSLDCTDRGCFASNEYLGKFIGVSQSRCAHIISELKKDGYIKQCFSDGRIRGLRINTDKPALSFLANQSSRSQQHSNTDEYTQNEKPEWLIKQQSGDNKITIEKVKDYFEEKKYPVLEAELFFNYYESRGWNGIVNFRSLAANWMLRAKKTPDAKKSPEPAKWTQEQYEARDNFMNPDNE